MSNNYVRAYTFNADIYCPGCIAVMFADGVPGELRTAEGILNYAAGEHGIDRDDEHSFDSSEFPKVVFGMDLNDERWEHCGRCHDCLDHDRSDCEVLT